MTAAVTLMGFPLERDGYGEAIRGTRAALARLYPDIGFIDMRGEDGGFVHDGRHWNVPGTVVCFSTPQWYSQIHADRLIGFTMFEATKIPPDWSSLINDACSALLVPCPWNSGVFRNCGVKVPVSVVPLGIDPKTYYPLYRGDHSLLRKPYTFLWSGTPDRRKGWDVAYRAFIQAFGESPDVRLILHFRNALPGKPTFADINVDARTGSLEPMAWLRLLREADCFVFPSRGEGWGLPPREAAATGLPALATRYGGLAVDLPEWGIEIGITRFSPAEFGFLDAGTAGEWPEPDVVELAERMRRCVERPDDFAAFGARAASWLAQKGNWDRTAHQLVHALQEGT